VSGFRHHQRGEVFTDSPVGEQSEGSRQVKPQRPRHPQPARPLGRGDLARQPDLVGDAAADHFRGHLGGQLLSHLGLSEPHRLRRLHRRRRGFQLLQPGNPINPCIIADLADIPQLRTTRDSLRQLRQHPVQPNTQPIRR
jgi:hypothetical protein